MKTLRIAALVFALPLVLVGCTSEDEDPTAARLGESYTLQHGSSEITLQIDTLETLGGCLTAGELDPEIPPLAEDATYLRVTGLADTYAETNSRVLGVDLSYLLHVRDENGNAQRLKEMPLCKHDEDRSTWTWVSRHQPKPTKDTVWQVPTSTVAVATNPADGVIELAWHLKQS